MCVINPHLEINHLKHPTGRPRQQGPGSVATALNAL